MANNWGTQYLAILDAVVAAVQTAWGGAGGDAIEVFTKSFVLEEPESNLPRAYVQCDEVVGDNNTMLTDSKQVRFVISGLFAQDTVNGNNYLFATKAQALEAELYGATNLGGYSYQNQVTSASPMDFERAIDAFGVRIVFECLLDSERT